MFLHFVSLHGMNSKAVIKLKIVLIAQRIKMNFLSFFLVIMVNGNALDLCVCALLSLNHNQRSLKSFTIRKIIEKQTLNKIKVCSLKSGHNFHGIKFKIWIFYCPQNWISMQHLEYTQTHSRSVCASLSHTIDGSLHPLIQ